MPKMKTHSASKKRFKKKNSKTIKLTQGFRRHLLTKKSTKRKRALRKNAYVSSADLKNIKVLLPN